MTENLPDTRRSFEIEGRPKKLYISNQELISHGCKNCIWRLHKQCAHSIVKDDEFYEYTEITEPDGASPNTVTYSGYCPEYLQFLFGFAGESDSTSALWEKFALYVGRMQSLDDYKKYLNMQQKIETLEVEGANSKVIYALENKKVILRALWEDLMDKVRKGYSRIVDREWKAKENKGYMPGIMNAKVINFNTIKQIEEKE